MHSKIKIKFKVDKKSSTNRESKSEYKQYENQDRKWMMYIQINTFCKDIMTLLDKFNYNNIQNAMKILKIITFQLILFENSRNYLELREDFLKIIKCLNSEAVTNEILDKYEFYRKKESEPVCKEDWDKISINEELVKIYLHDKTIDINEILLCFKIDDNLEKREPLIYEIIK